MDTTDAQPEKEKFFNRKDEAEGGGPADATDKADPTDSANPADPADSASTEQVAAGPEPARLLGLDSAGESLLLESEGRRIALPVTPELRTLVRSATSNFVIAAAYPSSDSPSSDEDSGSESTVAEEPAPSAESLTPREIQTRIRAGETPEDIAATTGADLAAIRRYESPIVAERDYVIEQAQATSITRDSQTPTLGEVALDRLAARGVASEELAWSAHRIPGAQWTITLQFTAGELERTAAWSFEPRNRILSPLDDEARWLTESEEIRDEPIPARLAPVRDWVYDVDSDGGVIGSGSAVSPSDSAGAIDASSTSPAARTAAGATAEAEESSYFENADEPAAEDPASRHVAHQQDLLDELSSRRGRRQPITADAEDDPFEFMGEIPAAHPPASRPAEAVDAEILQLPEMDSDSDAPATSSQASSDTPRSGQESTENAAMGSDATPEEKPDSAASDEATKSRPARRGSKRPSVPSWDEIVFGARTD